MKHHKGRHGRQRLLSRIPKSVRRKHGLYPGGGLRGRLTRMFALTAVLAVILTAILIVGAARDVFANLDPARLTKLTPEEWDIIVHDSGRRLIQSAVRAAFLSALLAVIIAGLVTRQLTRPLSRLADAAEQLRDGKRDLQLPTPRRNDELLDLTVTFNELTASLAHLEAWRRSLIADIAHDLRTPLAVMRSEIEAMQDGIQPADEAALGRLHGEVLLLARLVTDLRLLSLAESGALPMTFQDVDVSEVLHALANAYARRAEEVGVQIGLQASSHLTLHADPDRLRQTLQNLLDNALHYAAPGAVELSATQDGESITISVRDHGPGFTPDALSRAFERFYRADASRTRDPQGRASSGLGLAIARALTEAQGGKLEARNHPQGGAEFSLSWSVAHTPTEQNTLEVVR